jgi:hypothetical protein
MTRKNKKMDNSRNGPSKTSPFIKMHRKWSNNNLQVSTSYIFIFVS